MHPSPHSDLYTGRPIRPESVESGAQRLVCVRLEEDGVVRVSTNRLLGDWHGLGSCVNRLSDRLSVPLDAPRKNGKRHATRGRLFDLEAIYDRLNRTYFQSRLEVTIFWGREAGMAGKRKRSIQFGSYSFDSREIRIHPALDSPNIPLFYIEYIVYHEMCHAHVGVERDASNRAKYHGERFKTAERRFAHFKEALDWEDRHRDLFFESKG